MASSDRGTKRTDPDTGKKFYDLNLDPVVSPYTGKSYPRSFFEQVAATPKPALLKAKPAKPVEDDIDDEDDIVGAAGAEIVSLEEVEAEESGDEDIPETEDVEVDEELGDDDADTFLEDDEDDDDELGFDVKTDEEP